MAISYDGGMPADVTAVIVTYNSEHVIRDLLDSIPAALDGLSADVVVVDNGSTDGTLELLAGRADCRLIRSTNVGYAAGINLGVRAAERTPAILVLNPDVRLHAGSVRPLLEMLRSPNTGIVAPQIRSEDGSLYRSLRREPTVLRTLGLTSTNLPALAEHIIGAEIYAEPQVVDWALGAVLLISRSCYDDLNGWDESYFLYSEETDFCLRARDRGLLTRYQPDAVATHIGGQSGQSGKTHAMQAVNRVRLYRRRHGLLLSYIYLLMTTLREISWIPRGDSRNRAAVVALLRPSRRPAELGCSDHLIPR
jgi:GT2 family glycosyltransferase